MSRLPFMLLQELGQCAQAVKEFVSISTLIKTVVIYFPPLLIFFQSLVQGEVDQKEREIYPQTPLSLYYHELSMLLTEFLS
jgi:hypothetical protein